MTINAKLKGVDHIGAPISFGSGTVYGSIILEGKSTSIALALTTGVSANLGAIHLHFERYEFVDNFSSHGVLLGASLVDCSRNVYSGKVKHTGLRSPLQDSPNTYIYSVRYENLRIETNNAWAARLAIATPYVIWVKNFVCNVPAQAGALSYLSAEVIEEDSNLKV